MEKIRIFLIFTIIIQYVSSQLHDFKIGEAKTESIEKQRFYRLELTDRVKEYLIINVKPSDNYEKYSDPDIYVSKENSYPSSFDTAEWYSISIGEDMIPIPNKALENSTYIHIGVKCKDKCEYELSAYYEDKLELFAEDFYMMKFDTNETSRIFHYKHNSTEHEKFEVFALAGNNEDVNMKVHFVYGFNSTRDISATQSWFNGLSAMIDTKYYYDCEKCYYRIEISSQFNSLVMLGIKLKNSVKRLQYAEMGLGTVQYGDRDCYNASLTLDYTTQIEPNEPFVLTIHSFMENAKVYLTKSFNDTNGDKIFNVKNDYVTKVTYADLKDSLICFTPTTYETTSYLFKLIQERHIEQFQRYNFLVNGMSLYGYLPANNVTTYRHWVFDIASTKLNINLKVVSGNPVLYAYICVDYHQCYFTSERVNTMNMAGSFFSSSKVNDDYHITIPNEKNTCYDKLVNKENTNMCSAVAIVQCQGSEECEYLISMSTDKDISLLADRVKVAKFVAKKSFDYYKITINDPKVQKMTVVVHSHTGDADLYASRTHKNADEDFNKNVSVSIGNRDTLEFYNENTVNITNTTNTLLGDFYIAVKGYTYAYYTIYYYTSTSTTAPDTYRALDSGLIYSDHINKEDKIKTYKFHNREIAQGTPYLITFNSLNCEGTLFYMKSETNTEETLFSIEPSFHHNQYLITKDKDFYNSYYGYTFGFKVKSMDSSSISDSENCLIYVGGVEKSRELVMNEGVPHTYTLAGKEDKMSYVYPHAFEDNFVIFSIYFEQTTQIKIEYRIGGYNQTEVFNKAKSILIRKEILKDNCNTQLCNVHLNVTTLQDSEATYRILAKSSNNKPVYVQKGDIKHDSITPSVYQYYYTDVALNEAGEISLHTKHGSAIMVGRIVRKGILPEAGADYKNIKLPKIGDSDNNLRYNPSIMSITFNSTDTANCYSGCQIYFAVYSKDKYSYNDYLTDYTVLVQSKVKPTTLPLDYNLYGTINNTADISYYKVKIADEADSLTLTVDCLDSNCEVYINNGDKTPNALFNNWKLNVSSGEKNKITISIDDPIMKKNSVSTLKGSVFTIGVASPQAKSIQYYLYAFIHRQGVQPIYELTAGTPQLCEVTNEDDYCDFLLHVDATIKNVIFYVNINDNFKTKDHQVTFYANTVNNTEYFIAKNSTSIRPRYKYSQETSYGLYGKPLYQYKAPGNESLLLLSVKIWMKGTFTLISTTRSEHEGATNLPKMANDYLIFVPPNTNADIRIAAKQSNYHAKMKRITGRGTLDYSNNKDTTAKFSIQKNSTTTEIMIQEDNVDLLLTNDDPREPLALLLRYDANLNLNFDEISVGPSQTIFYPHNRGGFPVTYYLPLKNIRMDVTVNLRIKDMQFEDPNANTHAEYEFSALIIDDISQFEKGMNNKMELTNILGVFKGKYDASLKTGRVTINAAQYNKTAYAIISLQPEPTKNKKYDQVPKSFTMQVMSFPENSLHHNITLPQKVYYYSMIMTNPSLNSNEDKMKTGHVYKLGRENSFENYMVIELASCSGEVDYALRDIDFKEEALVDKNPALLMNKTRHRHSSYDHFGKKIIEVLLTDDSKDLVLVVFPTKFVDELDCDKFTGDCIGDFNVGYAIRYRTFYAKDSFDKFTIGDKGLVSTDITEERNLKLYLERVSYENDNKEALVNYYVRLFYPSEFDRSMSKFYSICFAHRSEGIFTFLLPPSKESPLEVIMKDLPSDVDYVVSVLAQTKNEDENYGTLMVYTPITAKLSPGGDTSSIWITVLFIILSLFLLLSVFLIYRKYRQTKMQLDYEINDVRNLGSIPRSINQISEMKTVSQNEKYTTLTNESA